MLTVTANILVIIAFIINPQLRTINNYLIINLAFADLVVGLVSMNFYTAYIGRKFPEILGFEFHLSYAWLGFWSGFM